MATRTRTPEVNGRHQRQIEGLITAKEVARRTGLSSATVRRLARHPGRRGPRFPKPLIFGPRTLRWDPATIEGYLAKLKKERPA